MKQIEKIIYILLIIFTMISLVPKEMQNDTFFTIAGGRLILENGIQKEEQLVWHKDLEFTNPRWLFNVFITIIHNKFDFIGIYFFVIVFAVIEGLLYYYILQKLTKRTMFCFFITIINMFMMKYFFSARAQLISSLLLLIEFWCLENIKLKKTSRNIYAFLLIIMAILYVNIHASTYPIYLIMFLPYIVEYISSKIAFTNNDDKKFIFEVENIKLLVIVLSICFIEGFLFPIKFTPYTYMFKNMGGLSASIITELQPLTIFSSIYLTFVLSGSILILIFTKQKIRISDILFIIGFSILAMSNGRSLLYFLLISTVCFVRFFIDFINTYKFNFKFASDKLKLISLFIGIAIVILNSSNELLKNISNVYINYSLYPIGAANYINNNIDKNKIKIYNHFNFGSYLEYQGIQAFIDSRSELYTTEFNPGCTILEDFKDASELTQNYNDIFDKYEITHVLLYSNEPISNFIKYDSKWKFIYQDDGFILYERVKT